MGLPRVDINCCQRAGLNRTGDAIPSASKVPDPQIPERDAFAVAGKSEVSVFWDIRIEFWAHEFGDAGKVGIDNDCPI